jgi:ferredoxin--NADP+ reductase
LHHDDIEQIAGCAAQRHGHRAATPNPELMVIRVKSDFPRPPHKPGQYTSLGLGTATRSRLSGNADARGADASPALLDQLLCPGDDDRLLTSTAPTTSSSTSSWCALDRPQPPALTPRLFVRRKAIGCSCGEDHRHYTLDPVKPDDTVLFLATGTVKPHNYMLWELRGAAPRADCFGLLRPLPAGRGICPSIRS